MKIERYQTEKDRKKNDKERLHGRNERQRSPAKSDCSLGGGISVYFTERCEKYYCTHENIFCKIISFISFNSVLNGFIYSSVSRAFRQKLKLILKLHHPAGGMNTAMTST